MPSYRKRGNVWRVEVRRKGVYVSESFFSEADAVAWTTAKEHEINIGKAIKTPILCGLAALALQGCASVHETYTPDGRKAYTLNCSGLARGWDKCFEAAGNLCGTAGYDIIDRSDESVATVGGGSSGIFGAKTNERSMVIACKKPLG